MTTALALWLLAGPACVERPRQEPDERGAALLEDSKVSYKYTSHWGMLWKSTNEFLRWSECSAVCRDGRIEIVVKGKLWDGPVKELFRRTVSARRYLKMWAVLEALCVWELETKDYDELKRLLDRNLPEAAAEFLEETWAVVRLEQDTVFFSLRIKDRIHEITVYDAPGLRDQTYWQVFKTLIRFFGRAPASRPLAELQEIRAPRSPRSLDVPQRP